VWLEVLGQLKKSSDLIGNRTRDLSACSIVPQPNKLPRMLKSRKIVRLFVGTVAKYFNCFEVSAHFCFLGYSECAAAC
jgi:hypothetical protein